MTTPPRLRFAPSPTGHLHVGGARTALFNWLYARRSGGDFLLRIEDTDRARSSEEMTRSILDALAWLGLDHDGEVAHQADGLERHRRHAWRLLESGAAYRCFCAPAELEERRRAAAARGEVYQYERRCRQIAPPQAEDRAAAGEPFALRFAVPEGETAWEDVVHGRTSFANEHIEDFVVLRSDATPVYNLAVVSDDVDSRITHVLRGDDHLSNTPKQILIYAALGAAAPVFGHLPMILGPDGRRLSKRHGATSVEAFRERGILPEAMVNFLALLGWSPGDDREVMTQEELVEAFTLDRILKKSSVFDVEKLEWLNGQYLARAPAERLLPLFVEALGRAGLEPRRISALGEEALRRLAEQLRVRGRTVEEMARQALPYFADQVEYDPEAVASHWAAPAATRDRLVAVREALAAAEPWETGALEAALRGLAAEWGVGLGKLVHPLRLALLGVAASPGIFEVLRILGRERSLARIDRALGRLAAGAGTG